MQGEGTEPRFAGPRNGFREVVWRAIHRNRALDSVLCIIIHDLTLQPQFVQPTREVPHR